MSSEQFTSEDQGLRPVEVEGMHAHAKCAEAEGLNERIIAWHGEYRFADYAMNASTNFAEDHEFMCPLCGELFPQIVVNGEWI